VKLTDTKVKNAKASEKETRFPDGRGLYLLVTLAGGKLWRWKYRHSGQEKLMSFGKYPEVSLADARDKHEGARKLLAKGIDPMTQRKADKQAALIYCFYCVWFGSATGARTRTLSLERATSTLRHSFSGYFFAHARSGHAWMPSEQPHPSDNEPLIV
jgi:hypothetical protein